MISALTRFWPSLALVATLFVGTTAANCQTQGDTPHIKMTDVPIAIAIDNLTRLSNHNYIIDQTLFAPPYGSNQKGMVEPKLTFDWTNVVAEYALDRVLKENGLVMVQDKFTTVALITSTNHVANVVDWSLLVSTNTTAGITNGLIPQVRFMDVPLELALKNLVEQDHLNVVVDPKIATDAGKSLHKLNILSVASVSWGQVPTVSLHWENVTPKQALVALCEAYNLVIVKDAGTGVVSIKPRD